MTEENEDLAQLLAIVNKGDDEDGEQLTEEEMQQALDSPSLLHRQAVDEDEAEEEAESTECDDYDMSGTNNDTVDDNAAEECGRDVAIAAGVSALDNTVCTDASVKAAAKAGEYQFQMMEHHIFKGKHGKKLYKCDICYAVYRHSFSLKRHFIRSHINYGYLCETDVTNCGINLAASASLQTWKQQTADNPLDTSVFDLPELYCCHSCVLFFDDLPQVKGHVDDCHRNNSSGTIEPIRIPCSQCNMSFIQRHNLVRHVEVVHHGKRLYGCKHCSKKFQTIADRKKHEKSQHNQHSKQQQPDYSADELSPPVRPPSGAQKVANSQKSAPTAHKCLKCDEWFISHPELRKHVTKRHKECYHPCGYCHKFCFSKKQLTEHLRQKHDKTAKDNNEKMRLKKSRGLGATRNEPKGSPNAGPIPGSQQQLLQQNQFQAYFHCSLCYRRFLTYGSLIRHKQVAHRTTRLTERNCSRLTADTPLDREFVEPRTNAHEFEFYRNLAQRVAENLLYFVDGKAVNNMNSDYRIIHNPSHMHRNAGASDLSKYNFPEDYGRESLSPPSTANSEKLEFLFDCNLNTVKNPKFEPMIVDTTVSESIIATESASQKPHYICTACHQKISSELMAEHEANNHPNVVCTYVEMDPIGNIPAQLLLWQYHCAEGLLYKCPTAPTLAAGPDSHKEDADNKQCLKCTKCGQSFASVTHLHNHILECAYSSRKRISANISHTHAVDMSTQTPANTSSASTLTNVSHVSHNSSTTLNESHNTSVSSNTTEKAAEFSSPLSPCKTRSGRRRQISPDDVVKTKRTRNSSKNSSTDSSLRSQKSNASFSDDSVFKTESIDDNNNKGDQKQLVDSCVGTDSTPATTTTTKEVSKVGDKSALSDCNLPKRYSCKKCSKKFVYMDTLSKHQMSCKRVFNSKVSKSTKQKRILRNSTQIQKKFVKNMKSIKMRSDETKSHKFSAKNSSKEVIIDDKNNDNLGTNEDTEEEGVEEDDDGTECEENDLDDKPVANESTPSTSKADSKQTKTQTTPKSVDSSYVESLSGSSATLQEHRCPDCLRIFTYLANFRKHITNVCPVRKQLATDSADGPADDSQPLTSTPIPERKSPDGDEELMSTSEVQIVIKQEAPDVYSKDSNNNNSDGTKGSVNEEVLDSESKADEDDDVMDVSSVSPKDESKLDLWRVKQENPQFAFKGSPAQHHSCPYCQRGFTYLANYRKHIKSICPIRQQIDEKKKQVIEDSAQQLNADGSTTGSANKLIKTELPPTLVYTPSSLSVRSQIEDTVLTLLRDQTKQDQILQSSEDLVKFKSTPKGTDDSSVGQQSAQSGDTEGNANESVKDDSNADSKGDESSNQTKDNVNNNELTQSSTKTPSKSSSFRFRTFPCNICHKIFLSYVAMLKHRLSHKLSGGSAAAAADDNAISDTNELSADRMLSDNELVESNRDKEAANQALAASILKRSKDVIFSKMRVNSSASTTGKTTGSSPKSTAIKPIINTTDLLEKLARGGITTDAIQELSATTAKITTKSSNRSTKHKEVITIETNNNDSQAFNLQLSASTSGGNSHRVNSSHSNSGVEEIIIEANNLNDLDINVLKDGVIVAQDLQELIAVNDGVVAADEDCADGITKCPEVLLNLDDIENANEVWITITDSSALIQVPNHNTSANSNCSNNSSNNN